MSLSYDNKPSTMHEEFAMGSVSDARGEEIAPYEPGGAEEKVSVEITLP
jgi:hypothetical protein